MFNQRACVARYNEPVFYPNDPSSLLLPGSSTTVTTNCDASDEIDDYLNDDEDAGGVSLPSTTEDIPIHDSTEAHGSIATVHTSHESANSISIDHQEGQDTPESSFATVSEPGPSLLALHHAGPGRRGVSEDENVSESYLAVEGDPGHEDPQLDLQNPNVESLDRAWQRMRLLEQRRQFVAFRLAQQNDMIYQDPHRQVAIPTPFPLDVAPDSNNTGTSEASENVETHIDEDAMAVDDPRRNYDFAEFMDLWRLRSIKDRLLPKFEIGPQPSIRLGRPVKSLSRRDVSSGAVDAQGIRWDTIGPLREEATTARSLLHPSPPTIVNSSRRARKHERKMKHYQFRSFAPAHKAKVCHYQLRNVLGAASRNEIFYATGSQVRRTSLACPELDHAVHTVSNQATTHNFGFRITCLSASPRERLQDRGIVVAGGFYGEYAICNLDLSNAGVAEGFVTQSYNGLVTHNHTVLERRSGLPQAVLCSNDRNVRLMDISTLQFTNEFAYEHAINCASTSPDGRLRVLVGDSQETLITNAETGQTLVTLREHGDHGFACDWARNGIHVATAAQDGGVLVWDARNWTKPCRSWGSSMSCARSVQWTDDGALVVAENDDVVRVYDGASGKDYQEIAFFGSIAGVALIDGGKELLVANADKTVGGLLCFERTAQGYGVGGSCGEQVDACRLYSSIGREPISHSLTDVVI